jgi:methylthioribose-1-phosphate isomerase
MMERADKGLAFMLQYENVAWYEDGAVKILDRRVYPTTVRYEVCRDHREVAKAIADMVTQSAGPYSAAAMGMALAAHECRDMNAEAQLRYLEDAALTLSTARPTTRARMEQVTGASLEAARKALASGGSCEEALFAAAVDANERRYRKVEALAYHLVERFPAKGAVMTQCFAETVVGMMLRIAREKGKDIKLFCPETRPYFQGARLTATVCRDMGYDVTVITDNMPAFVMKQEGIDLFTSAADAITVDGHVINKIGTYQIAIAAKYHGVPYYVTGSPEPGHPDLSTVKIEQRDPEFVLQAMGVRTAAEGVKGYYPAFDITPPELVSGVVTDRGIYSPYELQRYLDEGGSAEMAV